MKCHACGYEKGKRETVTVEEVVRYKSGKRKGEIKATEVREIEIAPGPGFVRLEAWVRVCRDEIEEVQWGKRHFASYYERRDWVSPDFTLYACPKCGTVKADGLIEGAD